MICIRVSWNCWWPSIPTDLPSAPVPVKSRQSRERTVESSFQRSLPWFENFLVVGAWEGSPPAKAKLHEFG